MPKDSPSATAGWPNAMSRVKRAVRNHAKVCVGQQAKHGKPLAVAHPSRAYDDEEERRNQKNGAEYGRAKR